MRAKDFNTGLRGVLFEAQHYERMGQAVWLYGWLVLRQTRQEGTMGLVLGGRPVSYREIEEETGFRPRTVERWMRVLRRGGYIETAPAPTGVVVRITKAKKFPQGYARTRGGNSKYAGAARNFAWTHPQNRVGEEVHLLKNKADPRGISTSYIGEKELESSDSRACAAYGDNFERLKSISAEEAPAEKDLRIAEAPSAPTNLFRERPDARRPAAAGEALRASRLWRAETREEMVRRELCVGQGPEVMRGRR